MKSFYIILLLMLALFASCRSSKLETTSETKQSAQDIDSVFVRVSNTTKLVTVPQATAKLNIAPQQLADLPIGAKYEAKQGNATATATKAADGTLEITANCDSLTLLINQLTTEVYRYKESIKALETKLQQKETKGLSGWQNFQIWCGRILLGLFAGYIVYRIIKK